MKKVAIFGASGSIGKNTIEVVKTFQHEFQVICLSVHTNTEFLFEQAIKLRPQVVVITDSSQSDSNISKLEKKGIRILWGSEGLIEALLSVDYDILINALVGAAGLLPTLTAIEMGKTVALANKESLVMAGELITSKAEESNSALLPIDSEHSAIFQCLVGENINDVRRVIITGSGGPFLTIEKNHFHDITVAEALTHPNWEMGKKITIDSATLMNKGLEIIEAHWLFDLPLEKIDLVIHPQSIIHSLVEFVDGSMKAQLGWPDMKLPIQYALTYPARRYLHSKKINLTELEHLTFYQPDYNKFPALQLAIDSIKVGGTATTVLNAANEKAVLNFLARKIPFTSIPKLIAQTLVEHQVKQNPTLDDIIMIDQWARNFVERLIKNRKVAIL
jgi:1-deoxy-D-xylulose-5-phosphate reductoisomerase